MKKMTCFINAGLILIWSIVIVGCGGSSISGTGGTKENAPALFEDPDLSQNFRNSVVQLPNNLLLTGISSSGKKSKKSKDEENLALNVYGGIFSYIKFAEFIKESIVNTFAEIYGGGILKNIELDVIHEITDDEGLTGIKLEKLETEFNWKLSLFNGNEGSPVATLLFSKTDDFIKGQLFYEFDENKTITVDGVSTTIPQSFKMEVSFEGGETKKSLTIKFATDLESMFDFANANWSNLTDQQKEDLDIQQAKNMILNITFENDEYSIGGTSYHPGWKVTSELENEDNIFGESNQTYMFKAKSVTGNTEGVKLAVALPDNELSDLTNVFSEASISKRFQDNFIQNINSNIAKSFDDVDDESTKDTDYSGDVSAEKISGFQIIRLLLGDENMPVQKFSDHGSVMSQSEMDAATAFWTNGDMVKYGIDTLEKVNDLMADSNTSQESKEGIYMILMAPEAVSNFVSQNIVITYQDLEVIFSGNDEDSSAFKQIFDTLSRIVNPAFFNESNGFLGTFDGSLFYVYNNLDGSLNEGDKPVEFDILNALDIDNINSETPLDVLNLVIDIK